MPRLFRVFATPRLKVALAAAVGLAIAVLVYLVAARLEGFDAPAPTVTTPTKVDPSAAIYGGTVPPKNRYPWIASLSSRSAGGTCTGFLIDPIHVLTAAHCANSGYGGVGSKVLIGGMQYDKGAETRTVTKVYKIGTSESSVNPNDWAIVELDAPVTSTRPVRVNGFQITVPDSDIENNELWAIGFGLQPNQNAQSSLMHAPVRAKLKDGMLHSAPLAPQGTCSGDSGAPLLLRRKDGDVIVGLTSGGRSDQQCGAGDNVWVPARTAMDAFFKQQDIVARVNACSYKDRGADKRCPWSHPWDSGTWDQGLGTPAGYAGKHCAQNMGCAVEMSNLYRKMNSKIKSRPHKRPPPPHKQPPTHH